MSLQGPTLLSRTPRPELAAHCSCRFGRPISGPWSLSKGPGLVSWLLPRSPLSVVSMHGAGDAPELAPQQVPLSTASTGVAFCSARVGTYPQSDSPVPSPPPQLFARLLP